MVHQLPQQLLRDGVTGLGPGVNNQVAYEGSGLDPCPVPPLSVDCPTLTEKFSGMGRLNVMILYLAEPNIVLWHIPKAR